MYLSRISTRFTRPGFWPAFITLVAFVTMMGLGAWQVKRLYWKLDLIEKLEQSQHETPAHNLPDDTTALLAMAYHPVELTGQFDHAHELHVGHYNNSTWGYHVVTPFTLEDGRVILINRGWIPAKLKDRTLRPETLTHGTVTLRGMVREANQKNLFTPTNRPEENLWFWNDIAGMEQATGLKLLPVTVDAVGVAQPGVYPVPFPGKASLRNDHLGYAITWFGIAIGCLVIFIVYHLRPATKEDMP